MTDLPEAKLSRFVWETRYRDSEAEPAERDVEDTWKRVAAAVAAIERDPSLWCGRFLGILHGFRFLPAGRILAGAGIPRRVTLANCFVMGRIDDSIEGIFEALKEGALTLQQGGGVGYDFSTLRPRGSRARTTGMVASGPVSFMHVWDAMCATVLSTGTRRGAMMATLRCDHPDIEEFIDAKRAPDALRYFNLSVLVTDAFMQAVKDGLDWPLAFPDDEPRDRAGRVVHKVVAARDLWQRLCAAAYDSAEPGVLFIDRINAANNLAYCESLSATNPCGEEPLPPFGACNLGSINLTAFVAEAFTPAARFEYEGIRATARIAVRFLDNVIDVSRYPLLRQREQAHRSRRIGLGITGLADALAMLTLRYDGEAARQTAARVMESIRDAAYEASTELAREKGAFPQFQAEAYLERPFIRALPGEIRDAIRRSGIRNSHLTAIAPAGAISLLAHNVSSGIEPSFGIEALRRLILPDGTYQNFQTTSYAYALWRARHGAPVDLPPYFVDGSGISARDHLLMQAALQPQV
ncbi:MAG TPA: adenosylcobalamin-dependent ribonucleoside-diphosphate reductase, partial [Steroidobacteraceae bacterium]|nr:adenosylcobalamin-dependent ribonucleoside-diphosphate reductase [Steroidobacteraceae bacterium]